MTIIVTIEQPTLYPRRHSIPSMHARTHERGGAAAPLPNTHAWQYLPASRRYINTKVKRERRKKVYRYRTQLARQPDKLVWSIQTMSDINIQEPPARSRARHSATPPSISALAGYPSSPCRCRIYSGFCSCRNRRPSGLMRCS